MKVSTWFGSKTYGIRVGITNRNQYFDSSWESILVVIDEDEYRFTLTKGFWNKCPEFRDKGRPIIKNWLLKHKTLNWPKGQTPKMELLSMNANKFKLIP
ncbi:hypothetical protein [Psychromonas hadalis]|uniref:hypothetical protein n=1 Tax=Psychromonas hadalis TaxID=211669 RepID=UPI0003B5B07C|nr:hypothetical protein [Psychromonas hadalis]